MNILVVAPTPFFSDRGTHIRILEEALALERRGHEVTIATYHIGQDLPEHLHSRIDVRRIRRLLFWYKKLEAGPDWQKVILDLLLIKKTLFLARLKKPDVIHGHLHEGVLIGWIVQKLLFWRNVKLVADFHGSLTKEMVSHSYLRASGLLRIFQWLERVIDRMGDRAITSSWGNTEEIAAIRGDEVATVLDGVSLASYQELAPRDTLREKHGVPRDKIVFTYTGALIANKGITCLIEALPLVFEKNPETHCVIAGFPWNEVERFFQNQPWLKRVTVITPLPYFVLPEINRLSDIGVDPKEPSRTRQASGKMLQYMGAGLPVACFDTPNNREYLDEGGEYSSEITAQGLAQAILKLAACAEERRRKGAYNEKRAAERFSWDRTGKQLEAIYQELV